MLPSTMQSESVAELTAVVRVPPPLDGEPYKRSEIVEMVVGMVGRSGITAIGQLESVGCWEVVFHSQSLKNRFLDGMRGFKIRGKNVVSYPLKSKLHWVRLTRIPFCVPNDILKTKIEAYGGKVVNYEFETDPNDEIMSNVRAFKVELEDIEMLPDRLEWAYDGMKGTGLLFVRGRKPCCDACGSRDHYSKDCSVPYCRRCRKSGHVQSARCGMKTYATVATPKPDNVQQPATATSPPPDVQEPVPQPTAQHDPEPETPAPQPPTPTEPVTTIIWSDQAPEIEMSETPVAAEDVAPPPTPATKDRARPLESASEAGSDADDQSGDRMEIGDFETIKSKAKKSRTANTDGAKPPTPKAATPGKRRSVAVPDPTAGRSNSRTPVTATRRYT